MWQIGGHKEKKKGKSKSWNVKKKKERKKNDEREVLVEAEVGAGLTVETDEGAQEVEIGGMYSKHMFFFLHNFWLVAAIAVFIQIIPSLRDHKNLANSATGEENEGQIVNLTKMF